MIRLTPMDKWIAEKIEAPDGKLTRERLESYQLEKLRDTMALVRAKSRFYREKLADFPAESLQSLEDLRKLPFTTPDDIKNDSLGFICTSQDDIHRIVTQESSGTTGAPKRIFFTAEDQELTTEFFQRDLPGVSESGDHYLILLPSDRPGSVAGLFMESARRNGVRTLAHGLVRDPRETLAVMEREGIDSLLGIPVQVLALASYEAPGERLFHTNIKNIILNTDYLPKALVRRLQDKWNCRVFNHYAMTEMGMAGGVECEAFDGLHLREADLLFEIVDPLTGIPVPDGEEGEVVFTTLTRNGMPLIRYRTGDISRFIPEPCPCGTVLKRLQPVQKRLDGGVKLSVGGSLHMAMLDEALFAVEGLINFQAQVRAEGDKDQLDLKVHVAPWVGDQVEEVVRQAVLDVPELLIGSKHGNLTVGHVEVDRSEALWPPVKRVIREWRDEVKSK